MTDMGLAVVPVEEEMKRSYIDYAMSVIVSRALPDVRDGLKPVHRRILYSMFEEGMTPDKPHRKSARIVGDVLGRYHPHGNDPVYEAMVRMAQDFAIRYRLIDGHGNFGSIDGDPPAAMRYTEARLSPLAMELLSDIEKQTVDMVPNFDETLEEPVVLPSRFPNLLVNGASGIAVGMATNIPPHNLCEAIDAVIMMIDNPSVGVAELMTVIKGPDFPTGGLILGRDGIKAAYQTGRGLLKVRAKAEIDQVKGRPRIVITEIPYMVNKSKLLEKIAELVRDRRIEGVVDLRDESDRSGLRIVVELRKEANPKVVLNRLFKYTPLESTFGVIMLALVDGQPKVLNLRELIYYYLQHQQDVVRRRTKFDLEKAESRVHILEGLQIALDNIDRVVHLIRSSSSVDTARAALMSEFNLSERQAQAILDMRLQRLTGLERSKLRQEYDELLKTIEYLRAVLASEKMVLNIIKQEILEIKRKYGDERRTKIVSTTEEFEPEDLIADEEVVVTLTNQGYIKRLPLDTYKSQKRGGRGIVGMQTKDDDSVSHLCVTSNHKYLVFVTNKGRAFRAKVYQIPEQGRHAKGVALANLIPIEGSESVAAVVPVKEFAPGQFLFMVTKQGKVKRVELTELEGMRRTGIGVIELAPEDELVDACLTCGTDEVILISHNGRAIRFLEQSVRKMGRAARGVTGIKLADDDEVVSLQRVSPGSYLLLVTSKGFGKRTRLEDYPLQSRAGKGVRAAKVTSRSGPVVASMMVEEDDQIVLVSGSGIIIRLEAKDVSILGRNSRGVTLMRLSNDDSVVAVSTA